MGASAKAEVVRAEHARNAESTKEERCLVILAPINVFNSVGIGRW
jgi:hypothetical protein